MPGYVNGIPKVLSDIPKCTSVWLNGSRLLNAVSPGGCTSNNAVDYFTYQNPSRKEKKKSKIQGVRGEEII